MIGSRSYKKINGRDQIGIRSRASDTKNRALCFDAGKTEAGLGRSEACFAAALPAAARALF